MNNSFPGRKDSIILKAIEIISDLGIQGLSTKELAMRQGITESLLYRHFKSKDEIVVAVINYYKSFDQIIMNTVLKSKLPIKDKIHEFIRFFTEYYENYPEIADILNSHYQFLKDSNTSNMVQDIFYKRHSFLKDLIKTGQQCGEIDKFYSEEELSDIIMGIFMTLVLKWRMEGNTFPLKERMLTTLDKLLANC